MLLTDARPRGLCMKSITWLGHSADRNTISGMFRMIVPSLWGDFDCELGQRWGNHISLVHFCVCKQQRKSERSAAEQSCLRITSVRWCWDHRQTTLGKTVRMSQTWLGQQSSCAVALWAAVLHVDTLPRSINITTLPLPLRPDSVLEVAKGVYSPEVYSCKRTIIPFLARQQRTIDSEGLPLSLFQTTLNLLSPPLLPSCSATAGVQSDLMHTALPLYTLMMIEIIKQRMDDKAVNICAFMAMRLCCRNRQFCSSAGDYKRGQVEGKLKARC